MEHNLIGWFQKEEYNIWPNSYTKIDRNDISHSIDKIKFGYRVNLMFKEYMVSCLGIQKLTKIFPKI